MNKPRMFRRRPGAGQQGVSIVELMVASLVGAIVVLATVQIFTANRQTFRMQDAMALTQESGTFALDFIVRDLLRAGYPGYPTTGVAFDWANTQNDVVNAAGTNDTLAVIYAPEVAGGTLCTGDSAGAAQRISNRYRVNETGQLVCQGAVDNGGGAFTPVGTEQVLVDNVESFQVMFGVDLEFDRDPTQQPTPTAGCPDSEAQPTGYVNAAAVGAAIARGAAPPACKLAMGQMQVVRSVRIALLVRTPGVVDAVVPSTKTYTVLDKVVGSPAITPDDGRMRRLFTKTVSLRNIEEIIE